jgi:hypothetical protein
VRCLSIRQPWAWLIIQGLKPIENRDWSTKVRGRVLIHAAKANDHESYNDACAVASRAGITTMPIESYFERGGIIGSVEIVDCVESSPSPWFFGRYGFVLRNPRPLPFVPFKGSLGFFEVPDSLIGDAP